MPVALRVHGLYTWRGAEYAVLDIYPGPEPHTMGLVCEELFQRHAQGILYARVDGKLLDLTFEIVGDVSELADTGRNVDV